MQSYARLAGVLVVISIVAGGFGEGYVPSRLIVSGDARATAENFKTLEWLFRAGFASYFVEALCDVTLSVLFYLLLRPVRRDVALLTAFFGLVGTVVFAASEIFYFAPLLMLSGADYLRSLSPDQLSSLALLSAKSAVVGGVLSILFYGVATVLRGYLIFRSSYLPRAVGALLMLGGLAFVTRAFAFVLAPAIPSEALLFAMAPGGVLLGGWLLAKGVDVEAWEAKAASMRAL